MMDRKRHILAGIEALIAHNKRILGIVSCGSFSRGDMDQFSDIDLYIFTDNIKAFVDQDDVYWLSNLGEVLSLRVFRDRNEGIDKIKMVLSGGLMYDLSIVSLQRFKLIDFYLGFRKLVGAKFIPTRVNRLFQSNITTFYKTIQRGYEVHHDNINLQSSIDRVIEFVQKNKSSSRILQCSEKELINRNQFFLQSIYTASVKLIRGEFFYVILTYDHYLKKELMDMIEWGKLIRNENTDVYYDAFRVKHWAGEEVNISLRDTLMMGSNLEMQQSLLRMLEIYREYNNIVFDYLGYYREDKFEEFVVDFIQEIALNRNE